MAEKDTAALIDEGLEALNTTPSLDPFGAIGLDIATTIDNTIGLAGNALPILARLAGQVVRYQVALPFATEDQARIIEAGMKRMLHVIRELVLAGKIVTAIERERILNAVTKVFDNAIQAVANKAVASLGVLLLA